jgi:hypothetical protein
MEQGSVVWRRLWLTAVFAGAAMLSMSAPRADELSQILRGFEIAPVRLDLRGKDWALVGLGSYLVNTTGCNDCHTHPNWADGHNPYVVGQTEQINTAQYMSGGRIFGPVASPIAISANITPDKHTGRPAGLTWEGFREVMRTGHDPRDPADDILQVMPWPLYRWKIDRELRAMYEYLRAIPHLDDNPNKGP